MRIAVFGSTGNVGSRIAAEALSRGHSVTAVVRKGSDCTRLPDDVEIAIGDVERTEDVAKIGADHDLVVVATRPPHGRERELLTMAKAILEGVQQAGVRLLVVGGAGGLKVPDTGGKVVDDPRYVGEAWRDIAQACADQLAIFRANDEADWTYLAPPAMLRPGKRTGQFRVGNDQLLLDADGKSAISMEDFSVAILDEAECPKHQRTVFTVAY